jgi:hypothetical protein
MEPSNRRSPVDFYYNQIRRSPVSEDLKKLCGPGVLATIEEETGDPWKDRVNVEIDKFNRQIADAINCDLGESTVIVLEQCRDTLRKHRDAKMALPPPAMSAADIQRATELWLKTQPHWNTEFME